MILYLYAKALNYSNSHSVFHEALNRSFSAEALLMIDVNSHEPEKIRVLIKSCEILVVDNQFTIALSQVKVNNPNIFFIKSKSIEFYEDIMNVIFDSDKPLFFICPDADLHAKDFGLTRELYLRLLNRIDVLFWPFKKYPLSLTDDGRYDNILEKYKLSRQDVYSIWKEIVESVPVIIEFPHSVSKKEMLTKAKVKYWDAIIPGANYETRKIARASAVESGVDIAPYQNSYRYIVGGARKIFGLHNKVTVKLSHKIQYALYRYLILHSSMTFVCGSELRFFVRKFLEVPSFRSVMISYPSLFMRDYGFIDGQSFIETIPEDFGKHVKFLKSNRHSQEKLINSAFEVVGACHTADHRVEVFKTVCSLFISGKLRGGEFKNGKFEYDY